MLTVTKLLLVVMTKKGKPCSVVEDYSLEQWLRSSWREASQRQKIVSLLLIAVIIQF